MIAQKSPRFSVLVATAFACIFSPTFVRVSQAQQQAPVPAVDVTDRAAVVNHFHAYYAPSVGVDPGWSGSLVTGDAGMLSDAFRQAALRRINYFRAMSGLNGDIVFDAACNVKCQQAALMMAAQQNISHTPPADWKFYSSAAAEACANSDIRLDWQGDQGALAIDKFIADDESNNTSVGHRRWLLYPAQSTMALGAVPGDGWTTPGTNATWVTAIVKRAATAPLATSWPPAGFVPSSLVYNRWSYSYLHADFSQATVSVTKNGGGLAVTQEVLGYQTTADGGGMMEGDNTVVWSLPGNTVNPLADETYQVTISNVLIAGARQQVRYTVTSINPDATTVEITTAKPMAYQGGKKGRFVVRRAGNLSSSLTVNYNVGGTASKNNSYQPLTGTVTIPAGSTQAKINVAALANRPKAVGKTVTVILNGGTVPFIASSPQATVTIAAQP